MIKVLVTGGRRYRERAHVWNVLDGLHKHYPTMCIVQGGASGADNLARMWCRERGLPCITMDAQWDALGPSVAGRQRNYWMLLYNCIEFVVAFPGGPGTADMKRQAANQGIKIYEA